MSHKKLILYVKAITMQEFPLFYLLPSREFIAKNILCKISISLNIETIAQTGIIKMKIPVIKSLKKPHNDFTIKENQFSFLFTPENQCSSFLELLQNKIMNCRKIVSVSGTQK